MAIPQSGKPTIYAVVALVAALLIPAAGVRAQEQPAGSSGDASGAPQAPNAPSANASGTQSTKRDDRIFGVMPNYTTVEGTGRLPPLSAGQKFKLAAQGAFDPYEFAIVGVLAGINQASDKDSSYGQGLAGYAKRYGAGFADQAVANFMTGAVFPSVLHQDPRYYRLGHGGFWHRSNYALSRIIIAPKDAGGRQFNYSEFFGNAAAAGISMTYRDAADRNAANAALTFGEQLAVDSLGNELKEFWPDIRRKVFKKKAAQEE